MHFVGQAAVFGWARIVGAAVLAAAVGVTAQAQCAALWIDAQLTPRTAGGAFFDTNLGRYVFFGGRDELYNFGSTWAHVATTNWERVAFDGPGRRTQFALAYDSARGRAVLYGGIAGGPYNSDLWEWSAGTGWKLVTAPGGPGPRANMAAAYDAARGVVVFFGGLTSASVYNADTWTWNGTTWTLAATTGPSARSSAAMTYDPARQRVVLFGGTFGLTPSADTWEWDGSTWTLASATGPSARSFHCLAYDAARGKTALFGGRGPGTATLNDFWEWDGTSWTQGPAVPFLLSKRYGASMASGPAGGLFLYGGRELDPVSGDSSWRGDTWKRQGTLWTRMAADPALPDARANAAIAFDSTRKRFLMFGGGLSFGSGGEYESTWMFQGHRWTQVASTGPSPRYKPMMAYDPNRDRIVLFGGGVEGGGSDETWELNPTALIWTRRTPAVSPPRRSDGAFAYDPVRRRVVLFGGVTAPNLGDTWEWDGTNWEQRSSTGPGARRSPGMVWNSATNRMVLHGGTDRRDTWSWDGSTWTQLAVTPPTGTSSGPMLGFDPLRQTVFMLRGDNLGSGDAGPVEYWELTETGWSRRTLTNATTGRHSSAGAFDPFTRRFLVFGGYTSIGGPHDVQETWEAALGGPPVLMTQPIDERACRGGSAEFEIHADAASYQWRLNGDDLEDGMYPGGLVISGSQTAVLELTGVSPADAGLYTCSVSNDCGSITTDAATLTVCAADFNCDAVIDFADYLEFLNLFDASDPRADLSGDGVVDFGDYLEFLNRFDTGC